MKKYEPRDWSYKLKTRKPTPEEEAILERWRKEVEEAKREAAASHEHVEVSASQPAA